MKMGMVAEISREFDPDGRRGDDGNLPEGRRSILLAPAPHFGAMNLYFLGARSSLSILAIAS